MKITKTNESTRKQYDEAKPDQFGNLHERMKYVMELLKQHDPNSIGNNLWHAIYDLETEVKHTPPANPPFGRRSVQLR